MNDEQSILIGGKVWADTLSNWKKEKIRINIKARIARKCKEIQLSVK